MMIWTCAFLALFHPMLPRALCTAGKGPFVFPPPWVFVHSLPAAWNALLPHFIILVPSIVLLLREDFSEQCSFDKFVVTTQFHSLCH